MFFFILVPTTFYFITDLISKHNMGEHIFNHVTVLGSILTQITNYCSGITFAVML